MQTQITCGDHRNFTFSNDIHIKAGFHLTVFIADNCNITAGAESYIQCRNNSVVIAGDNSSIDTGAFCNVITGSDSTVTAGPGSSVAAGEGTEIRFQWWCGNDLETTIGKVGEKGLMPAVKYLIVDGRITAIN